MGDIYDSRLFAARAAHEEALRIEREWLVAQGLNPETFATITVPPYGGAQHAPEMLERYKQALLAFPEKFGPAPSAPREATTPPATDDLLRAAETFALAQQMPKTPRAWERFAASLGL